MIESLAEQMRPKKLNPVREVVEQAGIDVTAWARNQNGILLDNPNNNIARNTQWSFGGRGEPIALFIWHEESDWASDPPFRVGNTKQQQDKLNALSDRAVHAGVKQRLRNKVNQTRNFQDALYEAKSKGLPVRVVLLDGHRTEIDDAGEDSSKVKARELDDVPWYAHGTLVAPPWQGHGGSRYRCGLRRRQPGTDGRSSKIRTR